MSSFVGLSNFRDVGGLATAAGRRLRTGVLYRSEELSRLTTADVAQLSELGLRLICDLRSPGEIPRRASPAGAVARVVNVPLHASMTRYRSRLQLLSFLVGQRGGERFAAVSRGHYQHIAFERTAQVRLAMELLADAANLPALIHCQAGRDRTGFLVALLQLLAGVPYAAVRQEYLRTNECFATRVEEFIGRLRRYTLNQVSEERLRQLLVLRPEFLDEVHEQIVARHGSAEGYLREACGVGAATVEGLRGQLLG